MPLPTYQVQLNLSLGAMDFKERLQKGYIGESLVLEYLTNNGYVVYANAKEQRHPIDMICFDKNDYGKAFFAEVKTKPKLTNYNGTGFSLKHLNVYIELQKKHNMDVFIYFVDFSLGCIYGNYVNELIKPIEQFEDEKLIQYPFEMGSYNDRVIIFGMENMIKITAMGNFESI